MNYSMPAEIYVLGFALIAAFLFHLYVFMREYYYWNKGICRISGRKWTWVTSVEGYRRYGDGKGNYCLIRFRWVDHPEEMPSILRSFFG